MSLVELLSDWVDRVCTYLLMIILVVMTGCLTILIFGRNFFGISFASVEELSRYTLVWLTFIGSAMVYKRNEHMAFDFVIVNFLRGKVKDVVLFLKELVVFSIIASMIYYGFEFVVLNINNNSLQLDISMSYVYIIIPLTGIIMLFHSVRHIGNMLIGREEIVLDEERVMSE